MKRWIVCLVTLVMLGSIACPASAAYDEDPARVAVNLQAIKVMLDANELTISYDEAHDSFAVDFDLENERLDACTVYLCAYEDGVAIEAAFTRKADKETRPEIILYLNQINQRLRMGNTYLDEDDGSVVFRIFLFTDVLPPTQYSLEYSMGLALFVLEHYGKAFEAMFFDGATAEQAWKMTR